MNQCLLITFFLKKSDNFLPSFVQENARSLGIEGTVQSIGEHEIKIFACGKKESLDDFIDVLHTQAAHNTISDIEIEPLLKARDFRGVFRIIE